MNIVKEKGLKDWDKILIIKGFADHIVLDIEKRYDDLKINQFNKIKKEYEYVKEDKEYIKLRRKEIDELLKSELISGERRNNLINEYNEIGLKYFGNNNYEIYEALELLLMVPFDEEYFITNIVYKVFFDEYLNNGKFNISDINKLMCIIKKYIKVNGYSFYVVYLTLSALILQAYDKVWQMLNEKNELEELREFFEHTKKPNPLIYNLYGVFTKMMKGISIDEFIQHYPIEKSYNGYKYGLKDYYSSIEDIRWIKKEYGDILNDKSSKLILSEILFDNKVLFKLGCKMFSVIEYGTGLDSLDLMEDILIEMEEEKKPKLIINNTKDN